MIEKSQTFRIAVADKESTSQITLDKLANDEDEEVRIEVAKHKNTSIKH